MEGMEYDKISTMSMDDKIDLHSLLAAMAVTKKKLGVLKRRTELSTSQDITAGHFSKATLLKTYEDSYLLFC